MSTSRKLVVKLDSHPRPSPKHRHAARKATSTEAARNDPEADVQPPAKQTKPSTAEMAAMTQGRTVTTHYMHTGTQFVCFCYSLSGKKIICRTYFVHLHISELTPGPSGTQSQTMPGPSHAQSRQPTPQKHSFSTARTDIVENFACQIHPLKFCKIFTLFFIPQGAAPRKGSANPPQRLTASLHHL